MPTGQCASDVSSGMTAVCQLNLACDCTHQQLVAPQFAQKRAQYCSPCDLPKLPCASCLKLCLLPRLACFLPFRRQALQHTIGLQQRTDQVQAAAVHQRINRKIHLDVQTRKGPTGAMRCTGRRWPDQRANQVQAATIDQRINRQVHLVTQKGRNSRCAHAMTPQAGGCLNVGSVLPWLTRPCTQLQCLQA